MRRWALPVAAGLAVAVVALVGLLAVSAPRADAERAEALSAQLRCPDCQGLSVADSPTRSAQEIRRQIDELIAAGATDDEVRRHFTERYGAWVLLAPQAPLLWAIPFVAVAAAIALLLAWLRRGAPGGNAGDGAGPGELPADERRRLHDEAEALDA